MLSSLNASAAAGNLAYTLSVPEPHSHFFEVEIKLDGLKQDYTDFKMAVWTPGSYMVREYAKNVEGFKAFGSNGNSLKSEKINKNTWRVYNGKADGLQVKYQIYCYELSVRNAYVDAEHGYLNAAAVFMFPAGLTNLSSTLTINPLPGWKVISTALKPVGANQWVLKVPDWDTFADSPIEMGNHKVFSFQSSGITHRVAMYGEAEYDEEKLKKDMKTITETAASVIGEHPCTDYTFLVHNIPNGGGGLEHLNSSSLQAGKFSYVSEPAYTNFLALVAHEYFHLWNVKRIRPKALGPFDYENENYTTLLWVSEGFTAYYDDYIVRRANLVPLDRYLETLASNIGAVENTPGSKVQSLAESSLDAWIKFYRPNENSSNSTVSYYTKGAIVAMMLDLEILNASSGAKSLDDVMRLLYATYYKKLKRGFTETEFQAAAEEIAGKKLDSFFAQYVYGTDNLDVNKYLAYVGLTLHNRNADKNDPFLGAGTRLDNGRLVVTSVQRNSPAWKQGIYVNDEIISVNGVRAGADLYSLLQGTQPGQKITVTIGRNGILQNIPVELARNNAVNYRIEKVGGLTESQEKLRKKWLRE